jgi:hypothetical protein
MRWIPLIPDWRPDWEVAMLFGCQGDDGEGYFVEGICAGWFASG